MLLSLNEGQAQPLYEQLYQQIKIKILNGSLACNEKLPSSRTLADQLSLSRSTVTSAYEQLLSEGYIYSKEKSGYYVSALSTIEAFNKNTSFSNSKKNFSSFIEPHKSEHDFSSSSNLQKSYTFSPFAIDVSMFPHTIWRRLTNEVIASLNSKSLLLGEPTGDLSFRAAIADYLSTSRGATIHPEQIIVGAGTDYLLMILCHLLPIQDKIAMENPTYLRAYRLFQSSGHTVLPVSVGEHGIHIEELQKSDADIVYVTPSHQYPLGAIMPVAQRHHLLVWAYQKDNRYIIEDDHDSEFRYKGLPIPCLQGMDTNERVIYLGTFSRVIAPSIRVSYMVLPTSLLKIYKDSFGFISSTVSRMDQAILTRFISEGNLERHVNKLRKNYHQKHDCMINCLHIFGDSIRISGENAGLHLVVSFQNGMSEEEITKRALAQNISLYSLTEHEIAATNISSPTFLFGFAGLSEKEIAENISKLYQALKA